MYGNENCIDRNYRGGWTGSGEINRILHDYSRCIIGRMGLPYREREISIISIVMDAPNETISALSGKLGMIPGVSTKTLYSKLPKDESRK